LPAGTPLKVIVDEEVRVRSDGQPVQGKTTEPIYAFDKLLVPRRNSLQSTGKERKPNAA
jgi:hypothetical protein